MLKKKVKYMDPIATTLWAIYGLGFVGFGIYGYQSGKILRVDVPRVFHGLFLGFIWPIYVLFLLILILILSIVSAVFRSGEPDKAAKKTSISL